MQMCDLKLAFQCNKYKQNKVENMQVHADTYYVTY